MPSQFATIQSAIQAAQSGDTIVVDEGTYYETNLRFFGKSISVIGAGIERSIISGRFGNGIDPVVRFNGGEGPNSMLADFSIADNLLSSPTSISGGRSGAGIIVQGASPTIANCLIRDNRASSANIFGDGGDAGGAWITGGNPTFVNCVFARNRTGDGAGELFPGFPFGAGRGAAASVIGGSTRFLGCTFTLNDSSGPGSRPGGGAAVATSFSGSATIHNSILWDNDPPFLAGGAFNNQVSGAVTLVTCVVEGHGTAPVMGTDILDVDPQLLGSRFHLAATSPCIDCGDDSLAAGIPFDYEGDPRIFEGRVDIGADEHCRPGSQEDFTLRTTVDNAGNPAACEKDVQAGDTVTFLLDSPDCGYYETIIVTAYQIFPSGSPPTSPPGFPEVHLDPASLIIDAVTGFIQPGFLDTAVVPPGLTGLAARYQAFAVAPFARNGVFAASRAHTFHIR